ncbi:acyl-ACP thioesterase domain-containing protein, partial [Methanobrevibacter gottschalkii]|uniref:acyl-ACP thioesterase domain-containing protein n=1 Tax=Methanobrevibacter gottschalkii TaxID=190974 RepID=UPI0038CF4622
MNGKIKDFDAFLSFFGRALSFFAAICYNYLYSERKGGCTKMEGYRKAFTVLASDTDCLRRLRLSRLFTLLQEAAIAHTEALGMGRAMTLDRGLLWIVALQHAKITRLPLFDERVVLESVPGK